MTQAKRMRRSLALLLALLLTAGLAGCGGSDGTEEIHDGNPDYHQSLTVYDAPKSVRSKDLTHFSLSFYRQTGSRGETCSYDLQRKPEGCELRRTAEDKTLGVLLTDEDVAGLQTILQDYGLFKLNGIYERTTGLPDRDGDYSLLVEYASGEVITASENGGLAGTVRQGFDRIRRYLEPFFIRNGDADAFLSAYPLAGFRFSADGRTTGAAYDTVSAQTTADGSAVLLAVTDAAGTRHTELPFTAAGLGALERRALRASNALLWGGEALTHGQGDPETSEGPLVMRYSDTDETGYFIASDPEQVAALTAAAAQELLTAEEDYAAFDSLERLTVERAAPPGGSRQGFSFELTADGAGARFTGTAYGSEDRADPLRASDLRLSAEEWQRIKAGLLGLSLIRGDGHPPEEEVSGLSFTMEFSDGRVIRTPPGQYELSVLHALLLQLLERK